jgi:cell division protein DivIC
MKILQDLMFRYLNIPSHFVNKYTLTGFVFFTFFGFIADNSVYDSIKLHNNLKDFEEQKAYYLKEIEKAKTEKIDLNTNLEKYAREKFKMHKENEEIFIIERN